MIRSSGLTALPLEFSDHSPRTSACTSSTAVADSATVCTESGLKAQGWRGNTEKQRHHRQSPSTDTLKVCRIVIKPT